ncbi:DUF6520 family protein [Flavobacterium hydatis]|jgi:hypothetical protein|uniref:Uncharacterized protein n=1 Tax=Flavobacterium hydatis TaxID=991 RepID=A0A086AIL5_FLAHY|nr:DUF6520 family protein [Flavobacterium hydatis]KFF16529.1 hypothetical protein IW20_10170 [Flavobacterium hydatis]OXA93925.1 hypothetical protein B0A62_12295 [Flavobacterium hydatis]
MKAIILKKMMPAAVFVLAISGAFLTMSMQSEAKVNDLAPVIGFVALPGNPCAIPVACDDTGGQVCRLFYPNGPQARELNDEGTTCSEPLFRPGS